MLLQQAARLAQAVRTSSAQLQSLRFAASAATSLQVCIVGSGPAGLYTANRLMKALGDAVNISIIDRLPTPFGLVRSGVAPDHPDTKNVTNGFSTDMADPRCSFLGNVNVGRDVQVAELRQLFNCVVLAYGAESDRRLGIPGEDLKGVLSAREFVWWYNGHPDMPALPFDLSRVESVAICGLGNVALDCARLLLRPPGELAATDVAGRALEQLRGSSVKRVLLLARRGPVQAACTPKELKELVQSTGVSAHIAPEALANLSAEDQAEMKAVRLKRRIVDLLQQNCKPLGQQQAARQLEFHFCHQPVEALADSAGNVSGLTVEKTRMVKRPDGSMAAEGSGQLSTLPVQLILKSIGYKSLPVPGVPFHAKAGIIPNAAGRVCAQEHLPADAASSGSAHEAGLYVVGWLKRGPTGIIGTNLTDAQDTVSSILDDVGALSKDGQAVGGVQGLRNLLNERGMTHVSWDDWVRLDKQEVDRGTALGKPREKMVSIAEMLQACHAEVK